MRLPMEVWGWCLEEDAWVHCGLNVYLLLYYGSKGKPLLEYRLRSIVMETTANMNAIDPLEISIHVSS